MKPEQVLHQAETLFNSHSIADARLEAELLLMHTLGVGRTDLYLMLKQPIPSSDIERFWELVQRRLHHEPSAYIRGHCEFYGIDFYIDSRALIPRPESELLVEKTLEHTAHRFPSGAACTIADVGTGSGVIAVSLALHLPQARICATDISAEALEVARMNCRRHNVADRICLILGDMLQPLPRSVDIIVANLPYVRDPDMDGLIPEIKLYEPTIALSGGADGLDKVRCLLSQAREKLLPGGLGLLEIGQGQSQAASSLARSHFPAAAVDLIPDLGGIERVMRVAT